MTKAKIYKAYVNNYKTYTDKEEFLAEQAKFSPFLESVKLRLWEENNSNYGVLMENHLYLSGKTYLAMLEAEIELNYQGTLTVDL